MPVSGESLTWSGAQRVSTAPLGRIGAAWNESNVPGPAAVWLSR